MLAAAGAAVALIAGIAIWALPDASSDQTKPELGLFTSLPIYWAESDSITETLDGSGPPHWARTALEADHRLVPLDTLSTEGLGRLDRVIMAQPRPLAPAENVALDDWVRGGGRLLLLADPMLTEHSRFMVGDKRRPHDVALLSPILRRWGLELQFDEDQPEAERSVRFGGEAIPIQLAGEFQIIAAGAPADCAIESDSLIARCRIGKGVALVVADAAVLGAEREPGAAQAGLDRLMGAAFAE